jgi:hypothetical protein
MTALLVLLRNFAEFNKQEQTDMSPSDSQTEEKNKNCYLLMKSSNYCAYVSTYYVRSKCLLEVEWKWKYPKYRTNPKHVFHDLSNSKS